MTLREVAYAFLRTVERRPELPETGIAHRICGMTCWFAGDFVDARQYLERAFACYDIERDRPLAFRYGQDLVVPVMAYLGLTSWPLGFGEDACRFVEKSVEHAKRTKHIPTLAYAHLHASVFEMMRRDRQRCAPHVRSHLELACEHMMPMWLAYGTFQEGWLRWHAGDPKEGTAQMHKGMELMRKQDASAFVPLFGVLLAETEAEAGHHDAALATIDVALARMIQTEQCWFLAEAHRVRGEFLLKSRPANIEAAEAAFTQAIEIARGQSAKRFEFRAALRLAQQWTRQGNGAEHRGLLTILAGGLADGSELDGFSSTKLLPDNLPGH